MTEELTFWLVQWRRKPYAFTAQLDVDVRERAEAIAIALAELGRVDVKVTQHRYTPDEEEMARVRERVWARVRNEGFNQ